MVVDLRMALPTILRHVFHELGAEVIAIGNQPMDSISTTKVGATAPEALSLAVRAKHADLGIALDGDADRLLMVDKSVKCMTADQLCI